MGSVVSVDVPEELARIMRVGEAELPRKIREALAIELYREELVSLGKAAEIAGLSVAEMMEVLATREVPLNYGPTDLESDISALEDALE